MSIAQFYRMAKENSVLTAVVCFLYFLDASIVYHIILARAVLGFFMVAVLPGLLAVCILRLHKGLRRSEIVVISIGLSASIIMIFSLLLNEVYPLFGVAKPLSAGVVVISLNAIIFGMAVLANYMDRNFFKAFGTWRLESREKYYLLIPSLFPPLSIIGTVIINTTSNNVTLLVLHFVIPIYAIALCVMHKKVPDRVFPLTIMLTSLSLVFLWGLRTNYLIGADVHSEFYLFWQTVLNGKWKLFSKVPYLRNNSLTAMLSITILPAIYQAFINANHLQVIFKLIYPLLFSVSPLVAYLICRKYLDNYYAFLGSMYFMSQYVFLQAEANARTVVAILFFGLAVFVLFNGKIAEVQKRLLFSIFCVSIILSHYSTAYIFLAILITAWFARRGINMIGYFQRKIVNCAGQNSKAQRTIKAAPGTFFGSTSNGIRFSVVVLYVVIVFLWYAQITGAPFAAGTNFVLDTIKSMTRIFVVDSRGGEVSGALGVGLSHRNIAEVITFFSAWLGIGFLSVGIVKPLISRLQSAIMGSVNDLNGMGYFLSRENNEFYIISLVSFSLLAASVVLPHVFVSYSVDRTYCQMVLILSPFFVFGGRAVGSVLGRKMAYWPIVLTVVVLFLSNTGMTYQMAGIPQAIAFNSRGRQYDIYAVHAQDSLCAKWLGAYRQSSSVVYSDLYGAKRLISQGGILRSEFDYNFIEGMKPPIGGYISFGYTAVVVGKVLGAGYEWHNISEYFGILRGRDLVYDNGGSIVYR